MNKVVTIADPSSHKEHGLPDNSGDIIIKTALSRAMDICSIKHEWVPYSSKFNRNKIFVLGGANILGSPRLGLGETWRPSVMRIMSGQSLNVVSIGCGWWSYEDNPGFLSRKIISNYLSSEIPHSTRDEYTAQKLFDIGVRNIAITGCPSLISHEKFTASGFESAIVTLTYYRRNKSRDRFWLEKVCRRFKNVVLFAQGVRDIYYFHELTSDFSFGNDFRIIDRNLRELDKTLSLGKVVHFGTRLHGNLYLLDNKVPSFCLSIDNRAREIKKTLPFLPICDMEEFMSKIEVSHFKYEPSDFVKVKFDSYFQQFKAAIKGL